MALYSDVSAAVLASAYDNIASIPHGELQSIGQAIAQGRATPPKDNIRLVDLVLGVAASALGPLGVGLNVAAQSYSYAMTEAYNTISMAALATYSAGVVMPDDEYVNVIFRGRPIGNQNNPSMPAQVKDLSSLVTQVQMSMSTDQISQIVFSIEDPGLDYYKSGVYYEGGEISYRNRSFIIATTDVNGGGSGLGGVTVTCRPKVVQDLKNRQGAFTMDNALSSDFVLYECNQVGALAVVQPTARRTNIIRDVKNELQLYSEDQTPSSWTTFQRLAQSEGYILFETYGIIFYCKPSWLYSQAFGNQGNGFTTIGMYWDSSASALGGNTSFGKGDPNYLNMQDVTGSGGHAQDAVLWQQTQQVPDITVSYDQQQGPAWTVTCQIPHQAAQRFYLGQRCIIRGMGAFNEATALIVSGIDYSMAGVEDATVTAISPYDPNPPNDTTANPGLQANGNLGSTLAGVNLPAGSYGGQNMNPAQLANAVQIYGAGVNRKAPIQEILAALATGITETHLARLFNPQIPASRSLPNDGEAPGAPLGAPWSDHSLGIFQQRDSWGTVAQRMDAYQSATLFYKRWEALAAQNKYQSSAVNPDLVGQMCQLVQVSAYPDRYAQNVPTAFAIYNAIFKAAQSITSNSTGGWTPGHPLGTKRAVDFVNIALSQVGKPYVFGYNVNSLIPVPHAFDCSLLVQWAAFQVGVQYPRDTWHQLPWCQSHGTQLGNVQDGFSIRGAVFFKADNSHTGISLGDGRTVEAYDTGIGVIINSPQKYGFNWGFACKIPGLVYE